jgi:glycosyltransferase involved in cell wall biosynthesis
MVVHQLAGGLAAAGVDVKVVALGGGRGVARPYLSRLKEDGLAVTELDEGSVRLEVSALRRLLNDHREAVIHTHGYRADLLACYARGRDQRWLSTVHGFTHLNALLTAYQIADRLALRFADGVIAVSDPIAQDLMRWKVPRPRLSLIRNVPRKIAPVSRSDARRELGLSPNRILVGWVGRFSAEKGPDRLPSIALALGQDAELVMVGDGPARIAVLEAISAAGVNNVCRWLGRRDDIGYLMSAFDVLALPSRAEGMPLTVLEAMSAGVPVVAFDVGDVRAAVRPDTGWLVPAGDLDAFTAAVAEAVHDEALRKTRGAASATLMAGHFDQDRWIAAHRALYAPSG